MQQYPVYLLWNRCKTLTGSPDPTRAYGTNRPCSIPRHVHTHVHAHTCNTHANTKINMLGNPLPNPLPPTHQGDSPSNQ